VTRLIRGGNPLRLVLLSAYQPAFSREAGASRTRLLYPELGGDLGCTSEVCSISVNAVLVHGNGE
jgi:hypothetical protein